MTDDGCGVESAMPLNHTADLPFPLDVPTPCREEQGDGFIFVNSCILGDKGLVPTHINATMKVDDLPDIALC